MRLPVPRPLPRPAGFSDVLGHWLRERNVIRQGFTALGISTGVGMAAGIVLASMEQLLAQLPGLLVLVPAAIGMRGAIFGALGARLGTGILTGQFTTELRGGTFTGQNVQAAAVLTLASSAFAALVARATAGALDVDSISVWDLMVVSMVGGVLSSAFILAGVLVLSSSAQRRGWDMDAIGSPLITATGDIVTLPALVVATLLLVYPHVTAFLGVVLGAAAALAVWGGLTRTPGLARRVVQESLPVLAYAAIVDVLAGTVLQTRIDALISNPALLVLIPPFIANCGSLGGILSARLGTNLHLGLLTPRLVPEKLARLEASLTVLFAVAAFTGVGVIAHTASLLAGFASPGLFRLIAISLAGGLLATGLLFAVAYISATLTYRLGLDPDNYGIPVVTATMDFLGVLCLVAVITVFAAT